MWTKIFLCAMMCTLFAVSVNADGVYLGPQLGYYQARDADNGAFIGGASLRLKFVPLFGAEGSINYRQESYANKAVTVRSWPVMVTGLIYPIPVAYGAIGAGWYNMTFDYNQSKVPFLTDETVQKFGWHFGGGVELPAGTIVKLVGDIRYVFLNYKFKEIPGSKDMKSDFFVIMVGVLFKL